MSFRSGASALADNPGEPAETRSSHPPPPEGAQAVTSDDSEAHLELLDAADPSLCNAASPMPASEDSDDRSRNVAPTDVLDAWADVPFSGLQNAPVATIPYSPRFAAVFGLLQAARERKEASPRALALASEGTRLCAADFTTWGYRCFIVRGLLDAIEVAPEGFTERKAILEAEDDFVRRTADRVPKSYQLWEYQRFLFELKKKEVAAMLQNGNGNSSSYDALFMQERARVDAALDSDDKNYHAWSHLGWLAREAVPRLLKGTSAETSGIDKCGNADDGPRAKPPSDTDLIATGARIRKDVRNNSAYAHRWATGSRTNQCMDELMWALDRTRLAPCSEAAWNYALALSQRVSGGVAAMIAVAREELADDERNVPARRVLVLAQGEGSCDLEERVSHCRVLATEVDVERYQYWIWKMANVLEEA